MPKEIEKMLARATRLERRILVGALILLAAFPLATLCYALLMN